MEPTPENEPPHKRWRPFYSMRSEPWEFTSSLTPNELLARLRSRWAKPYRVYGKGLREYHISATLHPNNWVYVRTKVPEPESGTLLSAFSGAWGQCFVGQIEQTETGSRLTGLVGLKPPSYPFYLLMSFAVTFLFFGYSPFGLLLYATLLTPLAVPEGFRAKWRRRAIWKFLNAATQTPKGEPMLDDIDKGMRDLRQKWAEARSSEA